MDVYRYTCDSDTYHSLAPARRLPLEWINRFNGQSLAAEWQPLKLRWEFHEEAGDFPGFRGGVPVVSAGAFSALEDLLAPCVEALPVNVDGDEDSYLLLNVIRVVDCLDKDAADFDYRGTPFILHIGHYSFVDEALADSPFFKIKDFTNSSVFLTEELRDRIESAGLKGLRWDALP